MNTIEATFYNLNKQLIARKFDCCIGDYFMEWRINLKHGTNTGSGFIKVLFDIEEQTIEAFHYHDFGCDCCGSFVDTFIDPISVLDFGSKEYTSLMFDVVNKLNKCTRIETRLPLTLN
jgi:hypothetical protein